MDILGIGPLELFFIIIIALIVLGPKDMVKAGRTIGRYLRMIVKSSGWQAVQQTSRELRKLPNRLMREAGLEEDLSDINNILPSNLNKKYSWRDLMEETEPKSKTEKAQFGHEKKGYITNQNTVSEWITPPSNNDSPNNPISEWITPPANVLSDSNTTDDIPEDQE